MNHAVRVALLSGVIALLPAFLAGLLLFDVPATRPLLEERVCGAGSDLIQRVTVRNQTSRSVTHHCRDAAGQVDPRSVSIAVIGQGMRLAWPPITAVIGLTWWIVALLRRGRAERREAEALRTGGGRRTSGPTVAGSAGTVSPVAGAPVARAPVAPGVANTATTFGAVAPPVVERRNVTLTRDEMGPEAAAIVERMVTGGAPSGDDVRGLLDALGRQGVPIHSSFTSGERTIDLGALGGTAAERPDVETSLRDLQRLVDRGLVTRQEYEARRAAILQRAFG